LSKLPSASAVLTVDRVFNRGARRAWHWVIDVGGDFLGSARHTGATHLLENPRVAGFTGSVVAIDDGQTCTVKRQPLVGGQGIDMPDSMHLPQVDFPLIAVRIA